MSLVASENAENQKLERTMEILVYLIPAALGLGLLGLGAFLWALRNGQFEDLDGAAHRVLMDDDSDDGSDETPIRAAAGRAAGGAPRGSACRA